MKNVVENIETQILFLKLFFSNNPGAYEVKWGNMVHPNRPHKTV
jgi:hypothetical protein